MLADHGWDYDDSGHFICDVRGFIVNSDPRYLFPRTLSASSRVSSSPLPASLSSAFSCARSRRFRIPYGGEREGSRGEGRGDLHGYARVHATPYRNYPNERDTPSHPGMNYEAVTNARARAYRTVALLPDYRCGRRDSRLKYQTSVTCRA